MEVTFELIGLTFTAEVDVTPFRPGRYSGPPEDCYPDEGGEVEITGLKCEGSDAMFLMQSNLADDLNDAAYAAVELDAECERHAAEDGE